MRRAGSLTVLFALGAIACASAPPPAPKPAPTLAPAPRPAPVPDKVEVSAEPPVQPPASMTERPQLSPLPLFAPPLPEIHRLKNGLEVQLVGKRSVPLVALSLVVRAGSAADPAALPGLAAATADMLDEGAGKRSAIEIADALAELGTQVQIVAGRDGSVLTLEVLGRNVEPALALMGDLVVRPRLDEADWKRVREQRKAQLLAARDRPDQVARDVGDRVLFGDEHPYGRPMQGTPESVEKIGVRDLAQFHARWYRPSNATLVVVGSLGWRELGPMLERALGGWKKGQAPALKVPVTRASAPRLVVVDKPGAPQSVVHVLARGVARATADYEALQAMATVLGGSFTSRLMQNLREKNGYTYGARSHFTFLRSAGTFEATAAIFTAKTAPGLQELLKELSGILAAEVSPAELSKAQSLLDHQLVEGSQTGLGLGRLYAELAIVGLPPARVAEQAARLARLTPAALLEHARKVIGAPDHTTIVIVGDRKTIDQDLAPLGLPAPEIRGLDGVKMK